MTAVLFTCAGQRVDIVSAFGRAGATTIAADNNELAPTLYHADRWRSSRASTDRAYVPALAALVREHDVRLVVPLTDLDQELLAQPRRPRTGARAGARPDRLPDDGGQVPRPLLLRGARHRVAALVAARRRAGRCPLPGARQGARGVRVAAHLPRCRPDELAFFLRYTTVDSFVQEACLGEEFSIDVFCDLEARCLNAIPRTMIQSKGGESIKGMSIKDRELIEHGAAVAERVGIVGPANVQCFREPDGSLPITDVNPRFGGAFPLPLAAGSRYPELALALATRRVAGAASR